MKRFLLALLALMVCAPAAFADPPVFILPGGPFAKHQIVDPEGVGLLPSEAQLAFTSNIVCVDNPGQNRTECYATGLSVGTDAVGTDELDDGSDTAVAGYAVHIDSGDNSYFEYLDATGHLAWAGAAAASHTHPQTDIESRHSGTDLTDDLEEDTHCAEHASADLTCSGETLVLGSGVVDSGNVSFNYAGSSSKGGAASSIADAAVSGVAKLSDSMCDATNNQLCKIGGTWTCCPNLAGSGDEILIDGNAVTDALGVDFVKQVSGGIDITHSSGFSPDFAIFSINEGEVENLLELNDIALTGNLNDLYVNVTTGHISSIGHIASALRKGDGDLLATTDFPGDAINLCVEFEAVTGKLVAAAGGCFVGTPTGLADGTLGIFFDDAAARRMTSSGPVTGVWYIGDTSGGKDDFDLGETSLFRQEFMVSDFCGPSDDVLGGTCTGPDGTITGEDIQATILLACSIGIPTTAGVSCGTVILPKGELNVDTQIVAGDNDGGAASDADVNYGSLDPGDCTDTYDSGGPPENACSGAGPPCPNNLCDADGSTAANVYSGLVRGLTIRGQGLGASYSGTGGWDSYAGTTLRWTGGTFAGGVIEVRNSYGTKISDFAIDANWDADTCLRVESNSEHAGAVMHYLEVDRVGCVRAADIAFDIAHEAGPPEDTNARGENMSFNVFANGFGAAIPTCVRADMHNNQGMQLRLHCQNYSDYAVDMVRGFAHISGVTASGNQTDLDSAAIMLREGFNTVTIDGLESEGNHGGFIVYDPAASPSASTKRLAVYDGSFYTSGCTDLYDETATAETCPTSMTSDQVGCVGAGPTCPDGYCDDLTYGECVAPADVTQKCIDFESIGTFHASNMKCTVANGALNDLTYNVGSGTTNAIPLVVSGQIIGDGTTGTHTSTFDPGGYGNTIGSLILPHGSRTAYTHEIHHPTYIGGTRYVFDEDGDNDVDGDDLQAVIDELAGLNGPKRIVITQDINASGASPIQIPATAQGLVIEGGGLSPDYGVGGANATPKVYVTAGTGACTGNPTTDCDIFEVSASYVVFRDLDLSLQGVSGEFDNASAAIECLNGHFLTLDNVQIQRSNLQFDGTGVDLQGCQNWRINNSQIQAMGTGISLKYLGGQSNAGAINDSRINWTRAYACSDDQGFCTPATVTQDCGVGPTCEATEGTGHAIEIQTDGGSFSIHNTTIEGNHHGVYSNFGAGGSASGHTIVISGETHFEANAPDIEVNTNAITCIQSYGTIFNSPSALGDREKMVWDSGTNPSCSTFINSRFIQDSGAATLKNDASSGHIRLVDPIIISGELAASGSGDEFRIEENGDSFWVRADVADPVGTLDEDDVNATIALCGYGYNASSGGCTVILPKETVDVGDSIRIGRRSCWQWTNKPTEPATWSREGTTCTDGIGDQSSTCQGIGTDHYCLSDTLGVQPGVKLIGEKALLGYVTGGEDTNNDGTVLEWTGASGGVVIDVAGSDRLHLEAFGIDMDGGTKASSADDAGIGIRMTASNQTSATAQFPKLVDIQIKSSREVTPASGSVGIQIVGEERHDGDSTNWGNDQVDNLWMQGIAVSHIETAIQNLSNQSVNNVIHNSKLKATSTVIAFDQGSLNLVDTLTACSNSASCIHISSKPVGSGAAYSYIRLTRHYAEVGHSPFMVIGDGGVDSNLGFRRNIVIRDGYFNLQCDPYHAGYSSCTTPFINASMRGNILVEGNEFGSSGCQDDESDGCGVGGTDREYRQWSIAIDGESYSDPQDNPRLFWIGNDVHELIGDSLVPATPFDVTLTGNATVYSPQTKADGTVFYDLDLDEVWDTGEAIAASDDLGSHIATQDLDMDGYGIFDADSVEVDGIVTADGIDIRCDGAGGCFLDLKTNSAAPTAPATGNVRLYAQATGSGAIPDLVGYKDDQGRLWRLQELLRARWAARSVALTAPSYTSPTMAGLWSEGIGHGNVSSSNSLFPVRVPVPEGYRVTIRDFAVTVMDTQSQDCEVSILKGNPLGGAPSQVAETMIQIGPEGDNCASVGGSCTDENNGRANGATYTGDDVFGFSAAGSAIIENLSIALITDNYWLVEIDHNPGATPPTDCTQLQGAIFDVGYDYVRLENP